MKEARRVFHLFYSYIVGSESDKIFLEFEIEITKYRKDVQN